MAAVVHQCRSLIISDHNLSLIGTRYSYKDYDEFYQRTFAPLQISNEDLLEIPETIEQQEGEEEEADDADNKNGNAPVKQQQPVNNGDIFDEDFW